MTKKLTGTSPKVAIAVRVPVELLQALDAEALNLGISRSELMLLKLNTGETKIEPVELEPTPRANTPIVNVNELDIITPQHSKKYQLVTRNAVYDRTIKYNTYVYSEALQAVLRRMGSKTRSGAAKYIVVWIDITLDDIEFQPDGSFVYQRVNDDGECAGTWLRQPTV